METLMEIITIVLILFSFTFVALTVRIVPQQAAYIVERLGKYSRTIEAGLHFILPFVDRV
ncbi:MAG: peptidase, partial [Bdellovibrionales bacterium]|nr:peptidase [Bdellovibrionales bacterium]